MGAESTVNGHFKASGLAGLQSKKSVERLEQISSLRARGISENIDLPQLVVCGDQSAGKSSVLEGLSNIPFPRADGLCTKFPTEVILEHSEDSNSITASIIPHSSRTDSSKSKLLGFHETIDAYDQLPKIIGDAGALMGLRDYGDNLTGPAFVEDVLRIKVVGRTGLHLSIVDLPGLISTASEEQTEADMDTVHRMVNSYIERPRTVILAIIQASNDIANQSIIRKSKQYDQAGVRTVGIITKLDLINKGTEAKMGKLAKNQDTTRLKLGYYVLKNPTPIEMQQKITAEERSANELRFFQASPWREQKLDPDRVGIDKLRVFLQQLLHKHIENELPKVRDEIRSLIATTQQDINHLPMERPTSAHLRAFLTELALRYHSLTVTALSGEYTSSEVDFFVTKGSTIGPTRLRALVHKLNGDFAADMQDYGQTMKQVAVARNNEFDVFKLKKGKKASAPRVADPSLYFSEPPTFSDAADVVPLGADVPDSEYRNTPSIIESERGTADDLALEPEQRKLTEAQMKTWVKETYAKTRGKELPGNHNHVLLTELFHQQCQRWPVIAERHLDTVSDRIGAFVEKAVAHLKVEDYVQRELFEGMSTKLSESRSAAEVELKQLCEDEQQQPITYNHYYTDNVQKSRINHTRTALERVLQNADDGNGTLNISTAALLASLEKEVIMNMDEQACSEALAGLHAYYKVALKTFVDNVCRQVIERHLLRNLTKIFSPRDVALWPDEELERVAGERPEVVTKRKELQEQLETLKAGLSDLRK